MTEAASVLTEVVEGRSSVRSFRPDPVSSDLVMQAIEAATWAPSPHGTQPWRFVIVDDHAHRRGLADAMADTWRAQLRLDTEDESVIEHRVMRSCQRLEQAPILVIFCLHLGNAHVYPDGDRQTSETLMAVQSLGAAAQNFLLSIHAAGLSSGWMCAPLFCPGVIRDYLGLESDLEPQALFPVGYMDAPPKRRERRPIESLVIRPAIGRLQERVGD